MTIRTLTTAATLVTTAALLLTACGGSTDSAKGKIQGAQNSSPTASATASTPSVQRPAITLPAGAKNVFEGQHSGDPKKDAVLADSASGINSVDEAILTDNPKTAALDFYETGQALTSAATYIQGYLTKHLTWIGTTRYFDRQVTFNSDGTTSVVYCSDESRSFLKNRKTGKVDNTPTSAQSYVLYNTRLKKNAKGVWQTTEVLSQRGAKQCQP